MLKDIDSKSVTQLEGEVLQVLRLKSPWSHHSEIHNKLIRVFSCLSYLFKSMQNRR